MRRRRPKKYEALDGLRAYSSIAIVLLHVFANGGGYGMTGFVAEQLLPSFTNLVFLFMIVSGFSMCCGYYDKVMDGSIDLKQFYGKRFAKTWPFFALLCAMELIISPNAQSVREAFLNLTLSFGLLTQANFSVIGAGWFLGVVFVFYFLFPFFCFLISDWRRAWLVLLVAYIMNQIGSAHYYAGRANFGYSAVFFLAGGLLYLYQYRLSRTSSKFKWVVLILCGAMTALYFLRGASVLVMLGLYSLIVVYALGVTKKGLLINPVTKFLSGISLEIYLCHMVIFRVLEKLKLTQIFGNSVLSYIFTCVAVLAGAIGFAYAANWCFGKIPYVLNKIRGSLNPPTGKYIASETNEE